MPSTSFVASSFSRNRANWLDVPEVDLGDLLDPVRPVLVVGQVVVPLGDPDLVERAVAAVVGEQQGRDAGRVGLEGQDQHVVHELDVFARSRRGCPAGSRRPGRGPSPNRSAFSIRVSISRTPVRYWSSLSWSSGLEPPLHRAGVVEDEVEDRPLLLPAALQVRLPLAGRAGAEEALEDQPRVGLGRHRRRRRAPGEVVLVGARVARSRRPRTSGPRRRPAPARGTA